MNTGSFHLIVRATEMAERLHRNHKRDYTGLPYFTHLIEVAGYVAAANLPAEAVAAALLHDAIEDVGATTDMIAKSLGWEVANLVDELTDVYTSKAYPKINRTRRKALERARLAEVSYYAKSIKLADLTSNARDIVSNDTGFAKLYLAEKEALLKVLKPSDSFLMRNAEATLRASLRALETA